MVAYYPTVFAAIASLVVSGKAMALVSPNVHTNFIRQLPAGGPIEADDIPLACQTVCAPVLSLSTGGTCTDPTCLCSATTSSAISGCLQCDIDDESRDDANDVDNDTDDAVDLQTEIREAQQFYDAYANTCNTAGQNVPPYVFVVGGTGGGAPGTTGTTTATGASPTTTSPATTATTSVSTGTPQAPGSSTTTVGAAGASGSAGSNNNNGNGASRIQIGAAGLAGVLGTTFLLLA